MNKQLQSLFADETSAITKTLRIAYVSHQLPAPARGVSDEEDRVAWYKSLTKMVILVYFRLTH